MQKDNIITVLVSVIASVVVSVALCSSVCGSKAPASAPAAGQDMNQAIEDYLMNNPGKVREALELAAQQEQIEAQKRIAELYKANWKDLSSYEALRSSDRKMPRLRLSNSLTSTADTANVWLPN